MGTFALSLYFGAGVLSGTLISLFVVRKFGLYAKLWKQLESKKHWLNQIKWVILTLFVQSAVLGLVSLINPSDEIKQISLGLGIGLMMALLPMKKV